MPPMHISWVDAGGFGKGATDAQTAGTVTKDINDDEVNRLVGEAMEAGKRLASLLDRKAEHVSTLTMLDEQHWDSVRRITETTEQLSYLTRELRSLDDERTRLNAELRKLSWERKELEKQWRMLRRTVQDSVGRDVCPVCGSMAIAPVVYGLVELDSDSEEPVVMGGCSVNLDEPVCCLDCGKRFLGNFEKWQRTQMESIEPETVLEVGTEGGSLAIVRQLNQRGTWEYRCLRDETTMAYLMPEEFANSEGLFEKSAPIGTFEDALLRLDKYPWFGMVPLKVNAEFADLVLQEVEKRGGKKAAIEWMESLRRHRFDD